MGYEFPFRTGKVRIDYEKCQACKSYACVKACSLFGRSILRIQDGRPALLTSVEETKRRCNECLSCQLYCDSFGNEGLTIDLDMFGLDKYRAKVGL